MNYDFEQSNERGCSNELLISTQSRFIQKLLLPSHIIVRLGWFNKVHYTKNRTVNLAEFNTFEL